MDRGAGMPLLQVYTPVSFGPKALMRRALGAALWLGGFAALLRATLSGRLKPLMLCTALAIGTGLPSPLGQLPPMPDFVLVYVWAARAPLCAVSVAWTAWSTWAAAASGGPRTLRDSVDLLWCPGIAFAMLASVWTGWGAAERVRRGFDLPAPRLGAPPRPRRPCVARLHPYCYCFFSRLGGVRIERLVGETTSFLDVWVRENPANHRDGIKRPILFFIHGGGWVGGGARLTPQAPLLHALAEQGWLVVSCEYRKARWPEHLEDCVEALQLTCSTLARRYDGDLEAISIAGASAGGHLATLVILRALREGICAVRASVLFYPALDPKDHAGATLRFPVALPWPLRARRGQSLLAWFFERRVLRDDADLWPSADPPALLEEALVARGDARFPRTLIVHGTHDSIVPIEHSRRWVRALNMLTGGQAASAAPGGEHRLVEVVGARHTFQVAPAAVVEAVDECLLVWLEQNARNTLGGL